MSETRLNPITVEIIGNSLASIADEILVGLIKSAYSTNIKERQDCSSVIMDAQGRVVCISDMSLPMHLSSFMFTGEALLRRHPKETLSEGDVFIVNDPYSGGPSHLADVTFVTPVFHAGELVAFVANTGHWPDVGGKAPGQAALGDATEIYQEGLRLPTVRLQKAGEVQQDILDIVLLNVRDPHNREGDIRAHMGSLMLGARRMKELAAQYDSHVLSGALSQLLDVAEVKARHGILSLAEGDYEALDHLDDDMDSDEPIPIRVKVSIRHKPQPHIKVDYAGTGGPARFGINMPYHGTVTVVFWVLRSILDPEVQPNAGFERAIEVVAPDGCLVNCKEPSPLGARYEVASQIPDSLFLALSGAVKTGIEAGGHGTHGMGFSAQPPNSFIYYETVGGGGGARPDKDGVNGVHITSNLPIEAMEQEFPMRADRLEYIPDSGGPGRFRGGVGVRKDWRMLIDSYVGVHSNRHRIPGPGLLDGNDGTLTRIVQNPGSDNAETLHREATFVPVGPDDVVTIFAGGGGGYGSPLDRDPALVARDVLDGLVTEEAARRDYGVILDSRTRKVDASATKALRLGMRSHA